MSRASTYQQRIDVFQKDIDKEKRTSALFSWARLISFLAIIGGVVFFFRHHWEGVWLLLTAAGVVAFLFFLVRSNKSQQKLQLLRTLLDLNQKELHQATTWDSLFPDGGEFINDQHDFSSDLDVFGPASIFQAVNRTGTLSGKLKLAAALRSPMLQPGEIQDTQAALQVLAPEVEFRQLLTANAILAKEEEADRKEIVLWLGMPLAFLHNKLMRAASWLLPLLTMVMLGVYIYTGHYYLIIGMVMVNWLVLGSIQGKIMEQYKLISHKERILEKFSILLNLVKNKPLPGSVLLQQQQEVAREADVALHQLSRISGAFDQRLNLLVGVVLNSLILYDLQCILRLEGWKSRHQADMDRWFGVVEKMEVWNSFATYAFNHPDYAWPQPQEEMILETAALGHPLIPEGESVKNDGSIGRKDSFLIITGSNMSGKSTFLRSVGANLLMAMCGAPVCADSFVFAPMRIMTSMRIKDSIASHTSYFQAELLRLQHIIQQLKTGSRVFILLDEILKGTNSEDKLSGSRSLIEHFLQYNCLGMIATHDLELGQLEDAYPARIRNYCFESTIQDDHLFFDYRIRQGIARNKNATFLMKQMEII